jgi:hypothetical protein
MKFMSRMIFDDGIATQPVTNAYPFEEPEGFILWVILQHC